MTIALPIKFHFSLICTLDFYYILWVLKEREKKERDWHAHCTDSMKRLTNWPSDQPASRMKWTHTHTNNSINKKQHCKKFNFIHTIETELKVFITQPNSVLYTLYIYAFGYIQKLHAQHYSLCPAICGLCKQSIVNIDWHVYVDTLIEDWRWIWVKFSIEK